MTNYYLKNQIYVREAGLFMILKQSLCTLFYISFPFILFDDISHWFDKFLNVPCMMSSGWFTFLIFLVTQFALS